MTEHKEMMRAALRRYGRLIEELYEHESDRGVILVAAALLDETLKELIEAAAVSGQEKIVAEILGQSGPLGSFSSRMRVAMMFGVVSVESYRDLDTIRKIRNQCAHDVRLFTFQTQSIGDLVTNLGVDPEKFEDEEFRPPLGTSRHNIARGRFLWNVLHQYTLMQHTYALLRLNGGMSDNRFGTAILRLRLHELEEKREALEREFEEKTAKELEALELEKDAAAKEMGISRAEFDEAYERYTSEMANKRPGSTEVEVDLD